MNTKICVILRHDVDRLPENALVFARIEKQVGIKVSYYFRIVEESFDEDIIRQIADMGHEIGYHYENLSAVNSRKEFHKLKAQSSKLIFILKLFVILREIWRNCGSYIR